MKQVVDYCKLPPQLVAPRIFFLYLYCLIWVYVVLSAQSRLYDIVTLPYYAGTVAGVVGNGVFAFKFSLSVILISISST